jgi:hypothetical protein
MKMEKILYVTYREMKMDILLKPFSLLHDLRLFATIDYYQVNMLAFAPVALAIAHVSKCVPMPLLPHLTKALVVPLSAVSDHTHSIAP